MRSELFHSHLPTEGITEVSVRTTQVIYISQRGLCEDKLSTSVTEGYVGTGYLHQSLRVMWGQVIYISH